MRYADAHADTFYRVATEGLDPLQREGGLHVNVPRMRDVGQVLQVCSVFTPKHYQAAPARDFADRIIDAIDCSLEANAATFAPVRTRRDLAGLNGRLGLIPWLEGASPLCGSLELLGAFFQRGVRGIGLTHNHANEVADGCGVAEPRRGLSTFGRDLVGRMNQLGVAVDCAHLPQPAFDEVMALAKAPPCISHTGCRALVNITRNADDAMLRAIADRGGIVGIDFYPGHLKAGAGDAGGLPVNCQDVADHVQHAVAVCGRDHVAIGGDFDGFADTCIDLRHVGDMGNLESALHSRGMAETVIEAVFSGNLLRYLGEVLPA